MKLVRTLTAMLAIFALMILTVGQAKSADEEKSTEKTTSTEKTETTEKTPANETASPSASPAAESATSETAGGKHFTLAAEMIGKTKFWLPSTITVNQGDKVTLTLKNEIEGEPNQHGFSIPAYNITELITRGAKPKTVEFTADKTGIFPYICQIHPPHVGGQLVVLPKAP
jgi:plastocyanin